MYENKMIKDNDTAASLNMKNGEDVIEFTITK